MTPGKPGSPSEDTTIKNCAKPRDFRLQDYIGTRMTDWFSLSVLLATGVRDLLSQIFAAYADRRATIAALRTAETYRELANHQDLWFDYVADVGDGWNSTYSVAWCLAQPSLDISVTNENTGLARGELLLMGGDEVYPYASADNYSTRLERAYQAALPCTPGNTHPALFAIPGNHDWTDGLRGFMRRFCQGAWLGGWKTHQTRPYWSIQLPHGWWVWGVDSQMDDYIDQAQLDYFRNEANQFNDGDRVILCAAAPSWIYAAEGNTVLHRNLAFIETEIIGKHGAHLVLTLSGDLHHFSHYSAEDTADGMPRHKITCGGGGAFTHGTHHLPDRIELEEHGEVRSYRLNTETDSSGVTRKKVLPTTSDSRRLLWKNLLFPILHPSFGVLLGGFYLVYALVLANSGLLHDLAAVPLHLGNLGQLVKAYGTVTFSHLSTLFFLVLLLLSGYAFAQPDWHSNPDKKHVRKLLGGTAHALMHLLVLLPSLWITSQSRGIALPPLPPNWDSLLRFSSTMFLIGAVVGGWVFGIYLVASNLLAGFHRTEAFSAVRDENNKSFLRLRLTKEALFIYPLGLTKVNTTWIEDSAGGENRSWIQANGANKFAPNLIGNPIRLDAAPATRKK